jgi:hypothetical protein
MLAAPRPGVKPDVIKRIAGRKRSGYIVEPFDALSAMRWKMIHAICVNRGDQGQQRARRLIHYRARASRTAGESGEGAGRLTLTGEEGGGVEGGGKALDYLWRTKARSKLGDAAAERALPPGTHRDQRRPRHDITRRKSVHADH